MENRQPCRGVTGQGIDISGSGLSGDPAWLLILLGRRVAFLPLGSSDEKVSISRPSGLRSSEDKREGEG